MRQAVLPSERIAQRGLESYPEVTDAGRDIGVFKRA